MSQLARREVKLGIPSTVSNPAPPEESLDDFLASYSAIVADAAVRQVGRGDAVYRDDVKLEEGSDVVVTENVLKERIWAKFGPRGQHGSEFPALNSTTPQQRKDQEDGDDSKSILSVASSLKSLLSSRPKSNGPTEMPSALFIEDARGKAEMKPSRAQRMWNVVRHDINSPVRIMIENKTKGGLAGSTINAPVFQNDNMSR